MVLPFVRSLDHILLPLMWACMSTQVQPPSGTKQVPANGADQKSADKADFSQF